MIACNVQPEEDQASKTILAPNEIRDQFSFTQMGAKSLDYIILSTGEDYLIGQVAKFMVHKDYLFVLDQEYSESLYVFDSGGKLLHVIQAEGDGPEAIPDLADFSIDTKREELLVLTSGRKEVVRMSFEGEIQSRIPVDAFYHFLAYHQEEDKILLGRMEKQLAGDPYGNAQVLVLNEKGNVEAELLPASEEDDFLSNWFPLRPLQEGNGKVYYSKTFKYDIWEVGQKARLAQYLDYGKRSLESKFPEFNKNPEGVRDLMAEVNDYLSTMALFLPLPDGKWLHILEGKNRQITWHYIDEQKGENYLFKFLVDDIDKGFTGMPVGLAEDGFYYVLYPEMLYATMLEEPETIPERLRSLLENKGYTGDDQVLVKVTF